MRIKYAIAQVKVISYHFSSYTDQNNNIYWLSLLKKPHFPIQKWFKKSIYVLYLE